MELLAEDEMVILLLVDSMSLISSSITAFQISYSTDGLTIDVYIALTYSVNPSELLLRFNEVTEYQFHWDSSHSFYNLTFCKMLVNDRGYYCSFDPFDESDQINHQDNDYVKAKAIQVYAIRPQA